jgi:hypothetical protein
MAKIINILSETINTYAATTFLLASFNGEPVRFKITTENGNSYCYLKVFIQTKNYDLGLIASEFEIPGFERVAYYWDDNRRIDTNKANIEAGKKFIENVF